MNELNTKEIFEVLENGKSFLILINSKYNADILCSALAFNLFIKKLGKKSFIALNDLNIDEKYKFLKDIENISDKIFDPKKFTISINTNRIKAKELSYEAKDGKIEIYITSETENGFKKEDVDLIENNVDFDTVFFIGVKSKNDVEKIYLDNANFIDDKKIISINNKNTENFGLINFIDKDQKNISEIIFDILSFEKSELIDENIATIILTGIIENTNGLKSLDVSNTTISNVTNLIDLGADRDLIISNLFKNKKLEDFKNISEIFKNIKHFENEIIYSSVNNLGNDYDIKYIFENYIYEIKNSEIFVLFNKKENIIYSEVICSSKYNSHELTSEFKSIGDEKISQFAIASDDMEKVSEIVLNKIKNKLKIS